MLICFPFSSGCEINLLQSRLERRAITYQDFIEPKWSAAHNMLSEILRRQILCTYGLGSDELKKARREYMKKHPNFPQCD